MSRPPSCELCGRVGGELLTRTDLLRVVLVDDPDLPGYIRVIVNAHVAEMTDLTPADRARLLDAVTVVEAAQRAVLAPTKINIASLGNMTPHLHWHVIPRFADDPFFPGSIWSPRLRETPAAVLAARQARVPEFAGAIRRALHAG